MVWKTIRGRRVNVRSGRRRHLYSNARDRAYERAQFTRRYGRQKGRYVYGAVVGANRRRREAAKRRF